VTPGALAETSKGELLDWESVHRAEYLPSMLIGVSRAVDEVGGPESEALAELRTALGAALAAAERLRAERRFERQGGKTSDVGGASAPDQD